MEVFSRALLLGAFGGSGNAVKTMVMRAAPLQGTLVWRAGGGFDLEVVPRALVLGALGGSGIVIKNVVMRAGPLQGT